MISVGSYVVLQATPEFDEAVARVIDYDGDIVAFNLFEYIENLSTVRNALEEDSRIVYGMKEVVQTCQKRMATINDVTDFAFLFTLQDVETGKVNHCGIKK